MSSAVEDVSSWRFLDVRKTALSWRSVELIPPVALVVAVLVFAAVFCGRAPHSYIWIDEAFTLYHTDPRLSPATMQAGLATETNPPLHFWLLYGIRHLIADARVAGLMLNLAGVGGTCIFLMWNARRIGRVHLGFLVTTVYLLSATTIAGSMEIRPTPLARDLCVIAAALAATVRLRRSASRSEVIWAAVIGAASGISHVYGALFVGSVAAAMVVAGLVNHAKSMQAFGLVLGAACSLLFALWWLSINLASGGNLQSIAWLKNFAFYEGTLQFAFPPFFGPGYTWVLVAAGLILALASPVFRRSVSVWLVTAGLFLALPLIVSQRIPIIFYRYYIIEAPAFHVLLAFVLYDMVAGADAAKRPIHLWATAGAVVGLAAPILSGPLAASQLLHLRMEWRGAQLVREAAGACPSKTIRTVETADFGPAISRFAYSYAMGNTGLRLVDAAATPQDASEVNCRILGWMEHAVVKGIPAGIVPGEPSQQAALHALHLTNKKHLRLTIERHLSGFVILK